MRLSRRRFFHTTAGLAAAAAIVPHRLDARASHDASGDAVPDFRAVRDDFPWLERKVWLSAADYHPLPQPSLEALDRYTQWRLLGPGGSRSRFPADEQQETRELFGRLINAQPSEIAFVQSTTDAENIVVSGLGLPRATGNIVIDDLHYQASKYMYRMIERETDIELRIVPHRDWRIDPEDVARVVDRNTRLVSLALVSNINGFLHDATAICDIAHASGTYVYADIIQAAGAVPIDVRATGIDFAGCGTYKWLMGDFGFGFLYVREDLQDRVLKRTRWGVRQFRSAYQADSQFELREGAQMYEMGSFAYGAGVCAHASLKYIHALGVDNIRAHAKPLTDRILGEMAALGYPPITPPDNPTPIVSFLVPDPADLQARLDRAFGEYVVAPRRWEFTDAKGQSTVVQGLRISPSVYNNQADLDLLFDALS